MSIYSNRFIDIKHRYTYLFRNVYLNRYKCIQELKVFGLENNVRLAKCQETPAGM